MPTASLLILYTGLGLALALLRWRQGAPGSNAALDGLLWPLELARLLLLALGQSRQSEACCADRRLPTPSHGHPCGAPASNRLC